MSKFKNISPDERATLRPEIQELYEREQYLWDENRPEAIKKLHDRGQRSARENIADLCDQDSFYEYYGLAIPARRSALSHEELMKLGPADGVILGTASINGHSFDEEKSRCAILAYDQTVFAGTQGHSGHRKTDHFFKMLLRTKLPLIMFAGGGGGRPGDADSLFWYGSTLSFNTWASLGKLSGLVPTVAIVSRYCFAGNAALAGCCDVVIATKDSSIGMGGPVMIEGGGMGIVKPQEVGPSESQYKNGVIDILVDDDIEAVKVAKKYFSYFQGSVKNWEEHDQKLLREALPKSERRVYDIHKIIDLLCDKYSVLELRGGFGKSIITTLGRIKGKPFGILASNVYHLAGAIDSDAADKYARFMQLCNAYRIPMLNLVDCPGFMVGIEAESQALVRHACRLYAVASHLKVPHFTVVIRKAYGLGGSAMGFADFHENNLVVAWPTASFGSMGLEGSVKLAYKKELDAIKDPAEKQKLYDTFLDRCYKRAKPVNTAETMEIENIIDPAETREWIYRALICSGPIPPKDESGHNYIDTW